MNNLDLPKVNRSYKYKNDLNVELPVLKKNSGRPKKKNKLITHAVLQDSFSFPDLPKYTKESKYEPWMCDKAVEVMASGGFISSVWIALGITNKTYYKWREEIPEFNAAMERAFQESERYYEEIIHKQALGELRGNVVATIAIMNKKFNWAPKSSSDQTNNSTTNNINILVQNQTREQLIKNIEGYLNRSPELLSDFSSSNDKKNVDIPNSEIEIVDAIES